MLLQLTLVKVVKTSQHPRRGHIGSEHATLAWLWAQRPSLPSRASLATPAQPLRPPAAGETLGPIHPAFKALLCEPQPVPRWGHWVLVEAVADCLSTATCLSQSPGSATERGMEATLPRPTGRGCLEGAGLTVEDLCVACWLLWDPVLTLARTLATVSLSDAAQNQFSSPPLGS
jgi:hypothetical protein